ERSAPRPGARTPICACFDLRSLARAARLGFLCFAHLPPLDIGNAQALEALLPGPPGDLEQVLLTPYALNLHPISVAVAQLARLERVRLAVRLEIGVDQVAHLQPRDDLRLR